MEIDRAPRAQPGRGGSACPGRMPAAGAARPDDVNRALERYGLALARVPLAITLVDLEDLKVRAITEASHRFLGLPRERVVNSPVVNLLDPGDRSAGLAALEALRSGAIEFYRAHRHVVGPATPKTGYCAWARAVDIAGKRFALVRWVDPRVPGGPEAVRDILGQASAITFTSPQGIVRDAIAGPDTSLGIAPADLVGRSLVPAAGVDNLVDLGRWQAARIDAVSIAYSVAVPSRSRGTVELEAVATVLAKPPGWLVILVAMQPLKATREVELERHLWRIAAEIDASGILHEASATPGLALARIPDAAALTPRQWEVLRRIASGQRVPTIAAELFISQSTVRNHLTAIFDRFGVHSQPELLARLAEPIGSSSDQDALPIP